MFVDDHKFSGFAENKMSVTVCTLLSKNDLRAQGDWLVGPVSNSCIQLKLIAETLDKVVSIFCHQQKISENRLGKSITEMINCGEAAVSLSISRNFLESQDFFQDHADFIREFNEFILKAIEENNKPTFGQDLFITDSNVSESEVSNALVVAANVFMTRSHKLPREITDCRSIDDKNSDLLKHNTIKLRKHPPSTNTLTFEIQLDETVILTGFDFEKRLLFCRTDNGIRYSIGIDDMEIDKLRHLVDGQSFRKIRIKGMTYTPGSSQPNVTNPVFVELLAPGFSSVPLVP